MQKTCIVIPCFNEAKRLDFGAFDMFLKQQENIDFLFANDGSTDTTQNLLENFKTKHPGRVLLFSMTKNSGKAEAVRQGILEVCKTGAYEYTGFWDADLATPLNEIPNFLYQIKDTKKTVAMGSRVKRLGAVVERKRSRHLLGRVFSTFASIILKLPVYDTQCGAKVFRTDLCDLFHEEFLTSWLFDVELLARYRNRFGTQGALNDILEVPVNAWLEKGGSKLRFKHILKVPFELLTIYNKYN